VVSPREAANEYGSESAVKANERRATEAKPAGMPAEIDITEGERRIEYAVVPAVRIRTDVSGPRSIGSVVVDDFDIGSTVEVDADHLVRAVCIDFELGMEVPLIVCICVNRGELAISLCG